ncbi:MAG: sensor histidine kinase [Anaerolineae bacterium]
MDNVDRRLQVLAAEFERLRVRGVRSAPEMARLVEELRHDYDEASRQREELASLYEVARELAGVSDLSPLLKSIVSKAVVLVGAERGIVVACPDGDECSISAALNCSESDVEPTEEAFSSSLLARVLETRSPILTTNIQEDGRFELTQSIITQQIRSVLAVPLVSRGELQGAIYVDTRMSVRHFDESELRLLQAMASQAAMAIRSTRLYEQVRASNEELQHTLGELRETQDQLVQAERLAAVGRLAASVAHELRNPLMVMRNAIFYLERLVTQDKLDAPDTLLRYLGKLDAEVERQNKIINNLLFFSRNRPRNMTKVDLNAIINETLLRLQMPESITVQMQVTPDLTPISADADQLQQVFVNLLSNAVQAMPQGGLLTIRARQEDYHVIVDVADTGVGIPQESLSRLFQPFFTTKEKGIGLGLSVTQSIVEGHRGQIEVVSQVGEGTTFTLRWPIELIG